MVNNTQGLLNTYMGQSRLSNMQSQTGGSDIQTLEDQDPNEVRFDSRKPVETNIKDMLSQRMKMDATLSAGRVGGGSSTPAPPATNPIKVENNRWFAPVFNKYADQAYQIALTDPNYQNLKADKNGDLIDKQKSFLAKLMAEKDIKPSMTEIYDEANKRGLTVSPTDNRFKTIGAAQDIAAYVNDLEIKSRGANQGVWSKYEFYALKPGSNSAYNDELKMGYNKELQQIQNENKRRAGMGYASELTTSPTNAAEAAIIQDKARQGKIEGNLGWGSSVWDKELGKRRDTVAQMGSFTEPLPQIGEPKPPKYEAIGDDTIKVAVNAYKKPDRIPSSGIHEPKLKQPFSHPQSATKHGYIGGNAPTHITPRAAVQSYAINPNGDEYYSSIGENMSLWVTGNQFDYSGKPIKDANDFVVQFSERARVNGTPESKFYELYANAVDRSMPATKNNGQYIKDRANDNKKNGMPTTLVFADSNHISAYAKDKYYMVDIKVIKKKPESDGTNKAVTWSIPIDWSDPTSYKKHLEMVKAATDNDYMVVGNERLNQRLGNIASQTADQLRQDGIIDIDPRGDVENASNGVDALLTQMVANTTVNYEKPRRR